jgi:hypothetical protein
MPYTVASLANPPALVMKVFESRDQSGWFPFTSQTLLGSKVEFNQIWADLLFTGYQNQLENLNTTNLMNWYVMGPLVRESKFGAKVLNAYALAKDTIRGFGALGENWDGYGGAAISKTVTTNAAAIMDLVQASPVILPVPEISPNPNGTIALEWETPNGEAYIEIGNSRYGGYISARHLPPVDFGGEVEAADPAIFESIYEYLFPPHKLQATISDIRMQEPEFGRLAA